MKCKFYRNGLVTCSLYGNVCRNRKLDGCAINGVITNGERIRRMTDEELLRLLDGECPVSQGRVLPQCFAEDEAACDDCMRRWLAEPAPEETEESMKQDGADAQEHHQGDGRC